jgi:hypothetical protein
MHQEKVRSVLINCRGFYICTIESVDFIFVSLFDRLCVFMDASILADQTPAALRVERKRKGCVCVGVRSEARFGFPAGATGK